MPLDFQVTILGVNSALPVYDRHPSCQIVRYDDTLIMIDCGEGSQTQLSKYKIKRSKIAHICISHLHGDHCFGLPGLITSFSLNQRKSPLYIHGPLGIKRYIDTVLDISGSQIGYPLHVTEYNTTTANSIAIHDKLSIETFPLNHRVPTMGFLVKEHVDEYSIKSESIIQYNLTVEEIKSIKKGKNIERGDGTVISYEACTHPLRVPRSYAYVSDTVYDPTITEYITGANLLYHETTYLDDLAALAKERYHTTLGQAISIAKSAGAGKLITGHYSSRYGDISVFVREGLQMWEHVVLGVEGETYDIG